MHDCVRTTMPIARFIDSTDPKYSDVFRGGSRTAATSKMEFSVIIVNAF